MAQDQNTQDQAPQGQANGDLSDRGQSTQDRSDQDQPELDHASAHPGKLPAERQDGEPTRARPTFRPRCDIAETEAGLVLIADVPGATQDGLDIQLERRELTIRAAVADDTPEGMSPLYREYQVGDYERRFTLSGDFDIDRIEANLSNGVLTITLPKASQPEARRIEVKAG